MKGSTTVGTMLIIVGVVIMYAGWKNMPILSVIGIGSATQEQPNTSTGSFQGSVNATAGPGGG